MMESRKRKRRKGGGKKKVDWIEIDFHQNASF